MYPTKTIDNIERLREHNHPPRARPRPLASNPQYAGGIGCSLSTQHPDYFGSGDRSAIRRNLHLREPNRRRFYRSQSILMRRSFLSPLPLARGERTRLHQCLVSSIGSPSFYIAGKLAAEADPDRKHFRISSTRPHGDLSKSVGSWAICA